MRTESDRQSVFEAVAFWQPGCIPRPNLPPTTFLRWIHGDNEQNYLKRGNKEFSIESVGYDFNVFGYRSPPFEIHSGEARALFVGDSFTFGVGLPVDRIWSTLVTARLEFLWGVPVRQLNLGVPGSSCDHAAMLVHQTVERLQPDVVFVLWTYVARATWFPDAQRFRSFLPSHTVPEFAKEHEAYLRLATPANSFFNYVRNFHVVNDKLARLGIPFIWGNIEPFSVEQLEPYLPLDGFAGRFESLDWARDAAHPGIRSHEKFAGQICDVVARAGLEARPGR